jgi:hypothetical protein
MLRGRLSLALLTLVCQLAVAEQFAVFPDRRELRSPDGRFVVRSVEHPTTRGEFSGLFRALILEEVATGVEHDLYNYIGRVGVAWSGSNVLIVTDYASKRTARALVFRLDRPNEYLVIDKPHLMAQLQEGHRAQLERNDHVYLEVSRIEGDSLVLRVWGYGVRDPDGFRFQCAYPLGEGELSCQDVIGERK